MKCSILVKVVIAMMNAERCFAVWSEQHVKYSVVKINKVQNLVILAHIVASAGVVRVAALCHKVPRTRV